MATILPQGVTQFFDANGDPLAGGFVYFYVPNTTTPKDTWQDAGQSILNTNPVELNAAGEATIYGAGIYRQVVRDIDGNLIWDATTADTASGGVSFGQQSTGTPNAQFISASNFTTQDGQMVTFFAGYTNTNQLTVNGIPVLADTSSGPVALTGGEVVAGNSIVMIYDSTRGAFHVVNPVEQTLIPPGTMLPYTVNSGVSPTGYVFANGQTLSRSDHLSLWAAVSAGDNLAASEGVKTAGQYGPGNGTTTFTVPNLYADDGYFIRPVSIGRLIGTSQADELGTHNHTALFSGTPVAPHTHGTNGPSGGGNTFGGGAVGVSPTGWTTEPAGGFTPAGSVTVNNTGGTETRPKNIAYPVLIKT